MLVPGLNTERYSEFILRLEGFPSRIPAEHLATFPPGATQRGPLRAALWLRKPRSRLPMKLCHALTHGKVMPEKSGCRPPGQLLFELLRVAMRSSNQPLP